MKTTNKWKMRFNCIPGIGFCIRGWKIVNGFPKFSITHYAVEAMFLFWSIQITHTLQREAQ